jgi:phosphoribosylglycinamide formyltransferase-1
MPNASDIRRRVRSIAQKLPETNVRDGQHLAFDVRGKRFAYYLDDHHGDGRLAIACKAAPGVQELLVDAQPGRFFRPSYLGPRGWLGLYLDQGEVDYEEVADLLTEAYCLAAPKRLAALVSAPK